MARPNFAFLDHDGPIAIAHRGGNVAGPGTENTMAAFQAAYELGYDRMETDTIVTADGEVVTAHGSQWDHHERKTGLPLRSYLQSLTYKELQRSVAQGGAMISDEPVPKLGDVLEALPNAKFAIDPKTKEVIRPLARLLVELKAVDRVCIGSLSYARTKAVAAEVGGQSRICTGLGPLGSIAVKTAMLPGYLETTEAAVLHLPWRFKDLAMDSNDPHKSNQPLVTTGVIERAHDAGLDVHVWTINDKASMRAALKTGVDGIMSDEVVSLQEVMSEYAIIKLMLASY